MTAKETALNLIDQYKSILYVKSHYDNLYPPTFRKETQSALITVDTILGIVNHDDIQLAHWLEVKAILQSKLVIHEQREE